MKVIKRTDKYNDSTLLVNNYTRHKWIKGYLQTKYYTNYNLIVQTYGVL